jgi:circadian clock protein KaiC
MLGGGYYRGSSILVSGTAGTGKSTVGAHFARATCQAGERCLYFAFEESPDQIMRNMRSVGIDLDHWVEKGFLKFHASRPSLYGLEMHLVTIYKLVQDFGPSAVIVDPISNLINVGTQNKTKSMLTRMVDFLKSRQITALFTVLISGDGNDVAAEVGVSSLMDTWISLRNIESGGERNRGLYIMKSRGMEHSNQVREFRLTKKGVNLLDVYTGPGGALTGSARMAQEAQEKAQTLSRQREIERNQREIER